MSYSNRVRTLKKIHFNGKAVLYWMVRDKRFNDNWALYIAQRAAIKYKVPLHVCFQYNPKKSSATLREYEFLFSGLIETVESFLATSAIGAIWSSCSPDFGAQGVIERFSQIRPKLLIITDRYYYNGKEINILKRLPTILKKIKSIKAKTLLIHGEQDPVLNVKNSYLMNELIPDSNLIVIPNMRHLIEEEILDQFKDKLKIHLKT